jgi:hypothetical protein
MKSGNHPRDRCQSTSGSTTVASNEQYYNNSYDASKAAGKEVKRKK